MVATLSLEEEYDLSPSQNQLLTDLQVRVALLEERGKPEPHHWIYKAIIGVCLTGVFTWGWFITTSVVAIKQQLADGGNKQLVAELEAPKSQQQLEANLSTVIAQIQTARADNKRPNLDKVRALSQAITQVIDREPNSQEGWRATAELISYRSDTAKEAVLKPCAQDSSETIFTQPHAEMYDDASFYWHDCTLKLDDNPILKDSIVTKEFGGGRGKYVIYLQHVHVVFRGGSIPEFDKLYFKDCTFDFSISEVPTRPVQHLAMQLLTANEMSDVTVSFPKA